MGEHDLLRVVQWTTGNIARQAVRAVLGRPDLELVGAFAYSAAKVGIRTYADLPLPSAHLGGRRGGSRGAAA